LIRFVTTSFLQKTNINYELKCKKLDSSCQIKPANQKTKTRYARPYESNRAVSYASISFVTSTYTKSTASSSSKTYTKLLPGKRSFNSKKTAISNNITCAIGCMACLGENRTATQRNHCVNLRVNTVERRLPFGHWQVTCNI
jgi:hypothetical protein